MIFQGWMLAASTRKLQLATFLLSTLVAGCGQDQTVTKWNQLPIPIYASNEIVNNSVTHEDFKAAMNFWEQKAGRQLFEYRGAWDAQAAPPFAGSPTQPTQIFANVVFFQNPWPFPNNVIGQTTVISSDTEIQSSIIMINPNTLFCTGGCENQPYGNSQQKNFAHELGHFLGIDHSTDSSNVMYPVLQPGGNLGSVTVDQNALIQVTTE